MASATPVLGASSQSASLPNACYSCGSTDKKLSRCGQCHIEKYCSQACQSAAWPAHRTVCLLRKKNSDKESKEKMEQIAVWCGGERRKFGEFRGYRVIDNDVRILSHTEGLILFFPRDLWRKFDHELRIDFPKNENAPCWIAGKKFAFVKLNYNPEHLEGSDRDFLSTDVETVLNKIEEFANGEFINNSKAYSESELFTHGSFKDNPDMPRPFRMRLS